MPKAANTLHSDQVPSAQAGIAKSVVGRDTRAEERGSFCGTQLVRNGSDASGFSNHHFRISSVCGHSRYHWVLTIDRVSASARFAHSIFASDQADTYSLPDFPSGHARTQPFNSTNHFMPRNAWQNQARIETGDRVRIGVTDSARLNPNPDLARSGLRDLTFHYAKLAGRGPPQPCTCLSLGLRAVPCDGELIFFLLS